MWQHVNIGSLWTQLSTWPLIERSFDGRCLRIRPSRKITNLIWRHTKSMLSQRSAITYMSRWNLLSQIFPHHSSPSLFEYMIHLLVRHRKVRPKNAEYAMIQYLPSHGHLDLVPVVIYFVIKSHALLTDRTLFCYSNNVIYSIRIYVSYMQSQEAWRKGGVRWGSWVVCRYIFRIYPRFRIQCSWDGKVRILWWWVDSQALSRWEMISIVSNCRVDTPKRL